MVRKNDVGQDKTRYTSYQTLAERVCSSGGNGNGIVNVVVVVHSGRGTIKDSKNKPAYDCTYILYEYEVLDIRGQTWTDRLIC